MLRVKQGSDEIEVRFDHKWCDPCEIESMTGCCVDIDRRCSVATIIMNGAIVGLGVAICNPVDNFCRATGRKSALAHGLSSLSRNLRTAIWTKYKETCRL